MALQTFCAFMTTLAVIVLFSQGTVGLPNRKIASTLFRKRRSEVASANIKDDPTKEQSGAGHVSDDIVDVAYKMIDYCSCRCCMDHRTTCKRYEELPEGFTCPAHFCRSLFFHSCKAWKKKKFCNRACFCQKCKSTLSEEDRRCSKIDDNIVRDNECECDDKEDLQDTTCQEASKLTLQDTLHYDLSYYLSNNTSECAAECQCNNCIDVINEVFTNKEHVNSVCSKHKAGISPTCATQCGTCPTAEELRNHNKVVLGADAHHTSHK